MGGNYPRLTGTGTGRRHHGPFGIKRKKPGRARSVHSNMMAIGVLSALWQTGRRVPADVAVVSCDDIPFAEYLTPPLTTVRVPLAETGRQAVDLLLRSIAGEPVPERTPLLPVELIVCGSCGAPKPG
jgi:DNA-binding LacI/PurR family transcriptional regulator